MMFENYVLKHSLMAIEGVGEISLSHTEGCSPYPRQEKGYYAMIPDAQLIGLG